MTDHPGIPNVTADDLEAFVGVEEVAQITGFKPGTIRKLCQKNRIPHYQHRPGSTLLFLVSEIRQWLKGENDV